VVVEEVVVFKNHLFLALEALEVLAVVVLVVLHQTGREVSLELLEVLTLVVEQAVTQALILVVQE